MTNLGVTPKYTNEFAAAFEANIGGIVVALDSSYPHGCAQIIAWYNSSDIGLLKNRTDYIRLFHKAIKKLRDKTADADVFEACNFSLNRSISYWNNKI